MLQAGGGVRLILKALKLLAIQGGGEGENFQRHPVFVDPFSIFNRRFSSFCRSAFPG
jgi:hypothetical protein